MQDKRPLISSIQDLAKPIPGRLLIVLRAVWLVLALSALLITLLGIVAVQQTFSLPCSEQATPEMEICSARAMGLQDLGLSWPFFANWLAVFAAISLLPWFFASLLIFWRKSGEWFGLIFSFAIALAGISLIDEGIAVWAAFAFPPLEGIIDWIRFLGVTSLAIFLYFPDGKLGTRWAGWLVLATVVQALGIWFFPATILDTTSWPDPLPLLILIIISVLFVIALVQRYRYPAEPIQRQQIKWVVSAIVFLTIFYLLLQVFSIWIDYGIEEIIYQLSVVTLYKLASAALAASIVIAIFRYRLFEIDIIIQRTLVYATLTGVLALTYFVVIVILRQIINPLTGQQESPLIIVLTTLGIAALFNPLRIRIQNAIDRRFFRSKYDAKQTLEKFSALARDEVDIDRMSKTLLDAVIETMHPEYVELWVKTESRQTKWDEPNRSLGDPAQGIR